MNDLSCEYERAYACEKTAIVTTTPAPAPNCALGWVGFNGHCYQHFYNLKLDAFAAQNACNQQGGYLLKIDNDAELNFFKSYITQTIGDWIFVRLGVLGLNIYILHSVTTLDWRLFWRSITVGVEK